MGDLFQANFVQAGFTQQSSGGTTCFDPLAFDKTYFDTTCVTTTGGGGPYGHRRWHIPTIDNRQHDDDLALVLLEAA